MAWTEQRKELVRKLWAAGLSASQIASEVGEVSRNAVIGVIHREGWQRGQAVRVWTPERIAELKKLDVSGHRIASAAAKMGLTERQIRDGLDKVRHQVSERRARVYQPRAPQIVPLIRKEATKPRANPAPIGAKPVSLFELTASTCRWPLGGYNDPAEFFCGAAAAPSRPYCTYHQSVSCYGSGAVLPEPERATRRVGNFFFARRVA